MEQSDLDTAKFMDIPREYYPTGLSKTGTSFDDADILDFGCGAGLVSIGIAHHWSPKSVLGVEISDDYLQADAWLKDPELSLDISGDLGFRKLKPFESLGTSCFDIAVSWSVLEHVDRRFFDRQMHILYEALRPGGVCVFQVAPLYYSAEGHHLFGIIPDWSHLYMMDVELSEILVQRLGKEELASMLAMYNSLNRFTVADFDQSFVNAGFNVIDRYLTYREEGLPARLLGVFSEEVLTTEQAVWTLVKPG